MKYLISNPNSGETEIESGDIETLLFYLADDWRDGTETTTQWVSVMIAEFDAEINDYQRDDDGDIEFFENTIVIDPSEPNCTDDEHDWSSDHELVGGLEENPGVYGHGGGVICTVQCKNCGMRKINDSWAQNPANGEQGLDSVTYDDSACCA